MPRTLPILPARGSATSGSAVELVTETDVSQAPFLKESRATTVGTDRRGGCLNATGRQVAQLIRRSAYGGKSRGSPNVLPARRKNYLLSTSIVASSNRDEIVGPEGTRPLVPKRSIEPGPRLSPWVGGPSTCPCKHWRPVPAHRITCPCSACNDVLEPSGS
jgi:hypothetical protein